MSGSVRFPKRTKPAHYRGSYHVRAKAVRDAAYADPTTQCWRCHLPLHQCKPHRNGKPARWTAGHLIDGQVGGQLVAECSTCNLQAGARLGNARSRRTPTRSRQW